MTFDIESAKQLAKNWPDDYPTAAVVLNAKLIEALDEITLLREALRWYASSDIIAYRLTPNEDGTFRKDNGLRARTALGE